jgi:Tol biopolymer transport system component
MPRVPRAMSRAPIVLLAGVAGLLALPTPAALADPTTERVSVDSGERQADGASYSADVSGDGRFVAFDSVATNLAGSVPLVAGERRLRVYLRDRQGAGATRLVSVSGAGGDASGESYGPLVSRDGRYVAFNSEAADLLPGDTNDSLDVFVRDIRTGRTVRASVGPRGRQAERGSNLYGLSAGGRFVVFNTKATNLVPTPGRRPQTNVFVRDLETGRTTLETLGAGGQRANREVYGGAISRDGGVIAFFSLASNLVRDDTNGSSDVFVRDRRSGRTAIASVAADGGPANGNSSGAVISDDGRTIAFTSGASDLVADDANGMDDVFVRDLRSGLTSASPAASTAPRRTTTAPSGTSRPTAGTS